MAISTPNARAWIDEKPVSFSEAVVAAARWVEASAAPVFGHLGTDIEGARQAVLLADHAGAVLDHADSAALLADLDPIRETGGLLTTPLEAAVRADVVLIVGSLDPRDTAWLTKPARPYGDNIPRRLLHLRAHDGDASFDGVDARTTGVGTARLTFLAGLRAAVKQRPSFANDAFAQTLRSAQFGVATWNAAELEPLALEALHGLVRDLNETTRFSTLSTPPTDNALGVQTVCGWMTGFPLRTGFARGRPEHDPWRYDARRLVATGEADCFIWVSAFAEGHPAPPETAICLSAKPAPGRIRFAVAEPGPILYDARVGGIVAEAATATELPPSVGEVLSAICAEMGGSPC